MRFRLNSQKIAYSIALTAVLTLLAGSSAMASGTKDLVPVTAGLDSIIREAEELAAVEAANARESGVLMLGGEELYDEAGNLIACEANNWGYVNMGIAQVDNHLNVRKTPGDQGELVGKMTKNSACEILEVEGEWAHIKSGKVEGYAHMDYLLTGTAARNKAREVVPTVAVVTTTTLKVRDEPNTDSPTVTLVGIGERLEVVNQDSAGWVKIMLDDEEAYVSADYVRIEQSLETAVSMKELLYGGGISNTRVDLVQFAKKHVGNPYVWGGTSLTHGADCSGFVQSVYKKFGIKLPRTSREQAKVGTKINLKDAKPGDLIFYAKGGRVNHVAIYIGNGQVCHASSPKSGIKISNATYRSPYCIRRVMK